MEYEPYDMVMHEGPALRVSRLSVEERREIEPERFTYLMPVIEHADEVDDRLDWAVRRLYRERHADERPVDFDVLFDELEDYAEVALTRHSEATRRIREIVREERRTR